MKINSKKLFFAVWLAFSLSLSIVSVFPSWVFGQAASVAPADQSRCDAFKQQFNTNTTGNLTTGAPFFCSASQLILTVINYALVIAGSITVLFIIVGGFWYVTSAGNEEQAEKGRKTLINSIIGLIVITLSFTIVRIVSGTLSLGR